MPALPPSGRRPGATQKDYRMGWTGPAFTHYVVRYCPCRRVPGPPRGACRFAGTAALFRTKADYTVVSVGFPGESTTSGRHALPGKRWIRSKRKRGRSGGTAGRCFCRHRCIEPGSSRWSGQVRVCQAPNLKAAGRLSIESVEQDVPCDIAECIPSSLQSAETIGTVFPECQRPNIGHRKDSGVIAPRLVCSYSSCNVHCANRDAAPPLIGAGGRV